MGNISTIVKTIKKFFEPALNFPLYFIKATFSPILRNLYTITNIFFIQTMTHFIEIGDLQSLYKFVQYYAVMILVFYILLFLAKYGGNNLINEMLKYLQRKYMKMFISLDNNSVEKIGTGKMISIIDKGFSTWTNLIVEVLTRIVSLSILFCSSVYLIVKFGYKYILIFVSIFVIVLIFLSFMGKKSNIYRKKRVELVNENSRLLVKIIMSKFEILQNSKIDSEINVLTVNADKTREMSSKVIFYNFFSFSFPRLLTGILTIFVFVVFGPMIVKGEYSISFFVGLMLFVTYISNILFEVAEFYRTFIDQFTTVERLWQTFDEIEINPNLYKGSNFSYVSGNIDIKGLGFKYSESIFENLNFNIEGGKKTAFVGVSGSGKSTLIKLIAGYLRPTEGTIFVDGQSLSDINLKSYYSHVGYLTQDPSVFDGSIYENLLYGAKDNISDEDIAIAIKLANCDFIYDFKDGLDTQIGEKGVRLSGGQKQRLAIAKIFLKNPGIILLDEPTSALDSFSEDEITIAFNNLFKGRTVIIIAHRLQTVKNADDIIVFEKGKIIERGNHNSLVSANGVYAKMLELQSGF